MKLNFIIAVTLAVDLLNTSASVLRRENPAPFTIPEQGRLCDDFYYMQLYGNHTLEAHFQAIGVDFSQNASSQFLDMTSIGGYAAKLDSHILHHHVRFDRGVEYLLHDDYGPERPDTIHDGVIYDDISMEVVTTSFMRRWFPQTITNSFWYNVMISAAEKLRTPLPEYGSRVGSLTKQGNTS